jgi:hypothetical protein
MFRKTRGWRGIRQLAVHAERVVTPARVIMLGANPFEVEMYPEQKYRFVNAA